MDDQEALHNSFNPRPREAGDFADFGMGLDEDVSIHARARRAT